MLTFPTSNIYRFISQLLSAPSRHEGTYARSMHAPACARCSGTLAAERPFLPPPRCQTGCGFGQETENTRPGQEQRQPACSGGNPAGSEGQPRRWRRWGSEATSCSPQNAVCQKARWFYVGGVNAVLAAVPDGRLGGWGAAGDRGGTLRQRWDSLCAATLSQAGDPAGSAPPRPCSFKQYQVELQDGGKMFSIVPRAGSISQDSTAGQAQTKGPGWHSQPRGAGSRRVIYLISQWNPGNEWCLREMNTAQPTATGKTASRDLADAELGSHGCPDPLLARGRHEVGWMPAAFEAPQSKTEQEAPKTEHSPLQAHQCHPWGCADENPKLWIPIFWPQQQQLSWLLRSPPSRR